MPIQLIFLVAQKFETYVRHASEPLFGWIEGRKSPLAFYAEGLNANSGIELKVELARVELASR